MSIVTKYAPTVAELIEVLRELPVNATWQGYDDSSLIIYSAQHRKIMFIEPEADEL